VSNINVIKYEVDHNDVPYHQPSIFLAGPTVRGHQTHLTSWREEAVEIFEKLNFSGNIIVPEFSNKFVSDQYRYDLPEWEYIGLSKSHVILFWICRTRELIGLTTNEELGYWMGKCRDKVIYGRPDDSYRTKYNDIMWYVDGKYNHPELCHNFPIYNTLEKTIIASLDRIGQIMLQPFKFEKEI
jgi:hypothetical protein